MNVPIILDCVSIAGFSILIASAFGRKTLRPTWAKFLLGFTGIAGIVLYSGINLLLDTHWLVLTRDSNYGVHVLQHYVSGAIIGILFTLLLGGQIRGTKAKSVDPPN